jgi:EAL domain-containing protein (putative c-di-GMP-specific phosphodiesterase class I)
VADDDQALLRVVGRALEAAGFEVLSAEDGTRAHRLLANGSFDAVLTDVGMPGMSGLEVLRAVRERDLELPVLLMTGAPSVESAAEAIRYGACAYITKPVRVQELQQSVRRAVDLHRLAKAKRETIELLATGQPHAGDRVGLEVTLDRALDSMWMAYQPIVQARTRTIFGYESLLRSDEPALPNPGAILNAAERLGRLPDVGRSVRNKAPKPMSDAPDGSLLFINLHASDLEDDTLASSNGPLSAMAPRVVLEVTERASLDGVSDVRSRVTRLREMGFRIAVDDLGAGYAGLTAFAQLEPDFVKLDMSLVRDIHENSIKQKLVRSMASLCADMGIAVVAEGIEVPEERDTIVDLGCDLLQGYYLAKPGRPFPSIHW